MLAVGVWSAMTTRRLWLAPLSFAALLLAGAPVFAVLGALALTACASPRPKGPPVAVINRVLAGAPGAAQPSTIVAADEIAASAKPVTAFVTGVCASAAYWLSSQARELRGRDAAVGSVAATVSKDAPQSRATRRT